MMDHSGFGDLRVDYTSPSRHACPLCSAALVRTPRRHIDHFLSRFVPVQRFRCPRFSCQWQGNLRTNPAEAGDQPVAMR